jgi:VWFA-related protein
VIVTNEKTELRENAAEEIATFRMDLTPWGRLMGRVLSASAPIAARISEVSPDSEGKLAEGLDNGSAVYRELMQQVRRASLRLHPIERGKETLREFMPTSNPPPRQRMIALRYTAFALCLLLPAASFERGQGKQELPSPGSTLKVTTEVVNVYAVVKKKNGRLVADLNKDDFTLEEDKQPQVIKYFARETDTPLTMGILVDTSPSQGRVLDVEKDEAKAFLRQILRPKDLTFVLHFDVDVELLQDFTSDFHLLDKAIDENVINGGGMRTTGTYPTGDSGGATHLYDAIYLSARELLKNEIGRKVLILLTDGEDQGSRVKLDKALEAAQKSDVIIYCINISDRAFYSHSMMGYGGDSAMRKISDDTGGRVIDVKNAKDTTAAFQQIADELRTQYLLGYTPTNTKLDGTYRKIQLKLHDGEYKISARRGYYAPGG